MRVILFVKISESKNCDFFGFDFMGLNQNRSEIIYLSHDIKLGQPICFEEEIR